MNQITYFILKGSQKTSHIPKERAAILSKREVIILKLPLTEVPFIQKITTKDSLSHNPESSLLQISTKSGPQNVFRPTQVVLDSVSHEILDYFTHKSTFPVSPEGPGDLATRGPQAAREQSGRADSAGP